MSQMKTTPNGRGPHILLPQHLGQHAICRLGDKDNCLGFWDLVLLLCYFSILDLLDFSYFCGGYLAMVLFQLVAIRLLGQVVATNMLVVMLGSILLKPLPLHHGLIRQTIGI